MAPDSYDHWTGAIGFISLGETSVVVWFKPFFVFWNWKTGMGCHWNAGVPLKTVPIIVSLFLLCAS